MVNSAIFGLAEQSRACRTHGRRRMGNLRLGLDTIWMVSAILGVLQLGNVRVQV